jgi:hypothetical protein
MLLFLLNLLTGSVHAMEEVSLMNREYDVTKTLKAEINFGMINCQNRDAKRKIKKFLEESTESISEALDLFEKKVEFRFWGTKIKHEERCAMEKAYAETREEVLLIEHKKNSQDLLKLKKGFCIPHSRDIKLKIRYYFFESEIRIKAWTI